MAKKKAAPKPKTTKATARQATEPENTSSSSSAKRGRPPGSGNVERMTVESRPAVCPRCGSTERTVVRVAKTQPRAGVISYGPNAGQAYTHTVWRDTTCDECGQALREVSHENRGTSGED